MYVFNPDGTVDFVDVEIYHRNPFKSLNPNSNDSNHIKTKKKKKKNKHKLPISVNQTSINDSCQNFTPDLDSNGVLADLHLKNSTLETQRDISSYITVANLTPEDYNYIINNLNSNYLSTDPERVVRLIKLNRKIVDIDHIIDIMHFSFKLLETDEKVLEYKEKKSQLLSSQTSINVVPNLSTNPKTQSPKTNAKISPSTLDSKNSPSTHIPVNCSRPVNEDQIPSYPKGGANSVRKPKYGYARDIFGRVQERDSYREDKPINNYSSSALYDFEDDHDSQNILD